MIHLTLGLGALAGSGICFLGARHKTGQSHRMVLLGGIFALTGLILIF